MKSRRIIASFFFVVYIWAAIGALCSSLTCSCAVMHGCEALCARHSQNVSCARHVQEVRRSHEASCACASHKTARTNAAAAYSGPCCNHLHALYETLYTRCCDGERCRQHLSFKLLSEKLFAAALVDPAAWQPATPEPATEPFDRTIPPLRRGSLRLEGLRAPPVTV